jgi:hypothetical protein
MVYDNMVTLSPEYPDFVDYYYGIWCLKDKVKLYFVLLITGYFSSFFWICLAMSFLLLK